MGSAALAVANRECADFQLEYLWKAFTVCGKHLSFRAHCTTRLYEADCNHWGAAVYKWEGMLIEGEHAGHMGILIGETGDLRQRVKQYISGTQECGNKYWREQFLTKDDIFLYVLDAPKLRFKTASVESSEVADLQSNNVRLVLEQLLVLREVAKTDGSRWIVNRKL